MTPATKKALHTNARVRGEATKMLVTSAQATIPTPTLARYQPDMRLASYQTRSLLKVAGILSP